MISDEKTREGFNKRCFMPLVRLGRLHFDMAQMLLRGNANSMENKMNLPFYFSSFASLIVNIV